MLKVGAFQATASLFETVQGYQYQIKGSQKMKYKLSITKTMILICPNNCGLQHGLTVLAGTPSQYTHDIFLIVTTDGSKLGAPSYDSIKPAQFETFLS